MKGAFLLILCTVGAFGLSINFDSNVKGLEVKVNSPNNGTSSEAKNASNEADNEEPGGPTLQKFFEYLGPVKTIPQIVDETVERFQTIYRSPKDQLKSLEEDANPNESNVLASENELQRSKRSTDAISGKRLTPYRKITKRSGDDAPCVSNFDLQEHKLSENEEINAIREEMQKLKDLIVILRDQQHVVDILNGIQNQKNDLNPNPHSDQNNNTENAKLLKLMESLISQYNSQQINAQKSTTVSGKPESTVSLPIQRSDNFRQILTTIGTTTTVRPTTVKVKTEEPTKNSEEDVKELIGNLRNIEERLSRLVQLKQRMAETKEENREAEENRPAPPIYPYQDKYPGPYKNPELIPPPPRPTYPSEYPGRQEYESPRDIPYRPPFLDSSPDKRPIPYGRSSLPNERFQQRPLEGNPQEQQRNSFEDPTIQVVPPRNVEHLKMKLRSLEDRVAELGHDQDSNEEQQRHVENLQGLISNLKLEIQEATNRENRNSVQQSLNFIRRNKREIRGEDVNVERQAGELVDKLYNMLESSRFADEDDSNTDALLQQLPRASMERSIETEQRQLQSQIEQLKKQIDSPPSDEGNISKIPPQSSGDDSNTTPPNPDQARSSTDDEQSDRARTLSHHSGPSRYYHGEHSDNYGPGYNVQKHYGHKKADILGTIIEKIFDKLQHAIPAIVKGLVGDFIDGAFHDQGYAGSGSGYGYGYGYGADKYDYGHDISYKFKNFGLLGTLPLALLNILSTVSYFFKLLQKNKFIRNFLIPVGVIIAVTGLVAFLVFWFNYDAFAGNMYGGYSSYQKDGGYDSYQKGGYGGYQKIGYEDHQKGNGYNSYQKPEYKGVSYSPSYSYKKPYYRDSNTQSFTPPFTNLDKPALIHEDSFPGIITQINDHTKPKM